MPNSKSKKPQKKLTGVQLGAIITAIITGLCTVIAACVGLGVPIITSYFNPSQPLPSNQPISKPTPIPTPYYVQLPIITPAVAGEQLDFSPILINISPEEIPHRLGLNATPHDGIYLSQLWIFSTGDISWMVYYKDSTSVIAESETCTLIKDYPEEYQAPMNLKVDEAIIPVTIYTASRYSLKITGAEILLSNYSAPRTDIDYLQPFTPGGGGPGPGWVEAPYAMFLPVLADKTSIEPTITSYKVDFKWFEVQSGQGVEIDFPVKMTEAGTYQFQVKVFAIATNTLDNNPENIVLTTGRDSYSWTRIDDPRKYNVYKFRDEPPLELEPCP